MQALGEFALIERFFTRPNHAPAVRLGVGDDCALVEAPPGECLAISTDTLVAERHFFADANPVALGHKALAVNLSDLAAMGARPLGFTLALVLPEVDLDWLAAFTQGMYALADAAQCPLVGGDTTRGPLTITLTVFGSVPWGQALRRDGAQPGDDLWVSGALGGAAWELAQQRAARATGQRPSPVWPENPLEWPQPRLALGLALRGLAHAAIDLSDGLMGDLQHVLRRSAMRTGHALGATLWWPSVPLADPLRELPPAQALAAALAGGDDYELLWTAAPWQRAVLADLARQLDLPLSRVGQVHDRPGCVIQDAQGQPLTVLAQSYDHFR